MTETKTVVKKPTLKKCVALRALCTNGAGMVKKGNVFTCTPEEYDIFKMVQAV
tara:strand:+ start:919 stop:1077 length:159 start_codon:yes stop_codon:yes gene_type:complete